MIGRLADNASTIIVGLILLVIVIGIIRHIIKDKRRGKSSCGCGCSNCAMKGLCHNKK